MCGGGRAPDLFEVVVFPGHAQATLVIRRSDVAAPLAPREDVLELDHPRVCKEQRLIACRHERRARHHGVASLGEELDEAAPHLGAGR